MISTAHGATPAEAFVAQNIQQGLQILQNKQITASQRAQQFETLLLNVSDVTKTANFALGVARRTASPSELAAYQDAFRSFAIANYQSKLSSFSGQTLKVTGSVEHAANDYVVNTVMMDPNNRSGQKPLTVSFRTQNTGGRFFVVDISVEGISLALTERNEFASFLDQHHASVPALTASLIDRANRLKSDNSR